MAYPTKEVGFEVRTQTSLGVGWGWVRTIHLKAEQGRPFLRCVKSVLPADCCLKVTRNETKECVILNRQVPVTFTSKAGNKEWTGSFNNISQQWI